MKKFFTVSVAALTAFSLVSCGNTNEETVVDNNAEIAETTKEIVEEETASPEPKFEMQDINSPAPVKNNTSDFGKYVSNTYISTGNNYTVDSAEHVTYRAYFPVEEYGELEYRFYFVNEVDSTYDKDGKHAYVGQVGGEYTIESAVIADGGTSVDDEPTNIQTVTFDGNESKDVASGEEYWSDPITFDVPEGHYLVWEWTLTGTTIPANSMSNLTKTSADYNNDKGPQYCDQVPLPALIGADRNVKYHVAAIGDSITQGCQTEFMAYEFWAARIAQALGSDYSFWNCGLGWSRSSDAASDRNWLERTSNADIVIVAFGTNDIISGEYGGDGGNSAEEIDGYIRTLLDKLKDEDCSVIVYNAPPEDYREDMEAVRTEYNEILRATCEEYGVFYFDFASYLSTEEEPAHALYGGHPNGEGGQIVGDAFIDMFSTFLDK